MCANPLCSEMNANFRFFHVNCGREGGRNNGGDGKFWSMTKYLSAQSRVRAIENMSLRNLHYLCFSIYQNKKFNNLQRVS